MEQLRALVARVDAMLRSNDAKRVKAAAEKAELIATSTEYFQGARERLIADGLREEELEDYDELWARLAKLAHGDNLRTSYRSLLRSLNKATTEISIGHLTRVRSQSASGESLPNRAEEALVSTLELMLPSAAASYRQAVADLRSSRLSYRGTATELREALREALDHLAPDADVMGADGFSLEKGQTKLTMKQKVRHILKARGWGDTARGTPERAASLVEEMMGLLTRSVYDRASISTHTVTTREEVVRIKRYVDAVLVDLLEVAEA